jgi:general secretion pathway protein A
MYQEFFGLTAAPFELTPDPRFLYLPPRHQEALTVIQYAIRAQKGLTVLTGEVGLGKTTLVHAALAQQRDVPTWPLILSNPALSRDEFFEALADGFELGAAGSKTALLRRFEAALVGCRERGVHAALIVDEAQTMSTEMLEEVRLLGNVVSAGGQMLSIILVGQPELAQRLNEPALRQLKQRVALRCALLPLNSRETSEYITTRVSAAGGTRELFTPDAKVLIHAGSQGVPRLINAICDGALMTGFACNEDPVGSAIIQEVCKDLDVNIPAHMTTRAYQPVPGSAAAIHPVSVPATAGVVPMSRLHEAVRRSEGAPAAAVLPLAAFATVPGPLAFDPGPAPPPRVGDLHPPLPSAPIHPQFAAVAHEEPVPPSTSRPLNMNGPIGEKLITNPDLDSVVVDQFRKLAAVLHQAQREHGTRTVAVASAMAHEGKTLTAINLAVALATSYNRRVLLVDADLRRPSVHTLLECPLTPGLTDAVGGATGAAFPIAGAMASLSVVTAGTRTKDPISVISSDQFRNLLAGAAEAFDWVVLDIPPAGALPDAGLLTTMSDTTVLVVQAGTASYSVVQRAAEAIGADRIIGVVLNRVARSEFGATYGQSSAYSDIDESLAEQA